MDRVGASPRAPQPRASAISLGLSTSRLLEGESLLVARLAPGQFDGGWSWADVQWLYLAEGRLRGP